MRKKILYLFLILVAIILIIFGGVFLAIRFNWLNVPGSIDPNSALYTEELQKEREITNTLPKNNSLYGINEKANWCKISLAADANQRSAGAIFQAFQATHSENLLRRMLLAFSLHTSNPQEFMNGLENCGKNPGAASLKILQERLVSPRGQSIYAWENGEPWNIIKQGLIKDKDSIDKAAAAAGIQPRLLVSAIIVEQLRLYYTQRELFEKFFKPLKILANANKMAWGVMSIKEKMAIQTEWHLKDESSPFYLGKEKETLLDFPENSDRAKIRYQRLTNEQNHYYSYLYGALIIKQIETQWEKAGYPLYYRPEVVATLFNIGFDKSKPKQNPEIGGSTLFIENKKYFFGSLAYEFYYSGTLGDIFPYK